MREGSLFLPPFCPIAPLLDVTHYVMEDTKYLVIPLKDENEKKELY